MIFNVHAGHNPAGKVACGASGFLNESVEDRIIKNEVIRQLQLLGHTAYDCTCDDGKSVADVLNRIVSKCNSHDVNLDVSIHLNAGKGTGTEVLVYDSTSYSAINAAAEICKNISAALGIKNRGVKFRPDLYVLRNTKAQALLVEVCFVDNTNDASKYDAIKAASAIVKGLTGTEYHETVPVYQPDQDAKDTQSGDPSQLYYVQVGAFRDKANAVILSDKLTKAGFNPIIKRG